MNSPSHDAQSVNGRGALAGYALVPDLILTSSLSPSAKLVAAALCRSALPPCQWTSAPNGAIASRCGVHVSNITRALGELERAGFIVRVIGTEGLDRANRLGWSSPWSAGSPRRAIVLVWRLPGCPIEPRDDLPDDEEEYEQASPVNGLHVSNVKGGALTGPRRHIDGPAPSKHDGSHARSSIVVLNNDNNVDARGGQRPTEEDELPPTDEDIAQAKVWAAGNGPLQTIGRLILEKIGLPVPETKQRPSTKVSNDPETNGSNDPPKTGPLPPRCPPGINPAPFAGAMARTLEAARLTAIADREMPAQRPGRNFTPSRPAENTAFKAPQRPMAQSTSRGRPQGDRDTSGLLAGLPGRPEMVPLVVARIVREFDDAHSERFWSLRMHDLAVGALAMAPVLEGYAAASRYKDREVGRRVFAASVRRGPS